MVDKLSISVGDKDSTIAKYQALDVTTGEEQDGSLSNPHPEDPKSYYKHEISKFVDGEIVTSQQRYLEIDLKRDLDETGQPLDNIDDYIDNFLDQYGDYTDPVKSPEVWTTKSYVADTVTAVWAMESIRAGLPLPNHYLIAVHNDYLEDLNIGETFADFIVGQKPYEDLGQEYYQFEIDFPDGDTLPDDEAGNKAKLALIEFATKVIALVGTPNPTEEQLGKFGPGVKNLYKLAIENLPPIQEPPDTGTIQPFPPSQSMDVVWKGVFTGNEGDLNSIPPRYLYRYGKVHDLHTVLGNDIFGRSFYDHITGGTPGFNLYRFFAGYDLIDYEYMRDSAQSYKGTEMGQAFTDIILYLQKAHNGEFPYVEGDQKYSVNAFYVSDEETLFYDFVITNQAGARDIWRFAVEDEDGFTEAYEGKNQINVPPETLTKILLLFTLHLGEKFGN